VTNGFRWLTRNLSETQQNADQTALTAYWSAAPERLLSELRTSLNGLSKQDAERRLQQYGPNSIKPGAKPDMTTLVLVARAVGTTLRLQGARKARMPNRLDPLADRSAGRSTGLRTSAEPFTINQPTLLIGTS